MSDERTMSVDGRLAELRLALVVWAGGEPSVHPLEPGHEVVLGRSAPAGIVVDAPTLSREHVRIARTRTGSVIVTDLGSKNGVRVAGERVERVELGPGDAFDAGGVHVLVTAVGALAHGARRAGTRELLDAIETEIARQRFTRRPFTLAAVAAGEDADLPSRVRAIDRCSVLENGVLGVLLPELEPLEVKAFLERWPGARAGVVGSFGESPAALLEKARRALASSTPARPIVLVEGKSDELPDVVLSSRAIREVFALADRFATSDRPVLVLGETGTGKELVARRIHASSARKSRALRVLNCAAIPASLVESTLFGHEKGAFTGAAERKRGAFEEASGGTLFLDEIGELPPPAQAALLRVLETGRLSRVGSTEEVAVDVRVVAATHRDLEADVRVGRFREDLLHRVGVLVIRVPPLRDRPEDVVALAHLFLRRACAGRPMLELEPPAVSSLLSHAWPGNVRELRNTMERAALLATNGKLGRLDVARGSEATARPPDAPTSSPDLGWDLRERLKAFEGELIVSALEASNGNQVAAATLLGLPRRTLVDKISKLGLRRRWERGG